MPFSSRINPEETSKDRHNKAMEYVCTASFLARMEPLFARRQFLGRDARIQDLQLCKTTRLCAKHHAKRIGGQVCKADTHNQGPDLATWDKSDGSSDGSSRIERINIKPMPI